VADTLAFSVVDLADSRPPYPCSLCSVKPASFQYHIDSDEPTFQQLSGSCCLGCANNLLSSFEELRRARSGESTSHDADAVAN